MDVYGINILAVLVAAVAAFVIGFMWHGPLFGRQWIRMMGIPQSEVDAMQAKGMGPMIPHMVAAFVQQIVVAFVVGIFIDALGIGDVKQALLFAALIWLGFIATTLLNGVLWEKRKLELYFFGITYHLVSLAVIALIMVLWR